jgi:radical SAM enzyme (TIGR04100 family)
MMNLAMTISYELGNSLYLNITNRCTNSCSFCIRNNPDGVANEIDLWLEQEPTVDEVIEDIAKREIANYKEFVFCGYGEPMMRVYDIIKICKKLKEKYTIPIRINTNGQANLIYGKDITPLLANWVDGISISLNAKDGPTYQAICRSDFGEKSFEAMLDFAEKCKKYIPTVVLSVVDIMSEEDIQACRAIAKRIGVDFRVRHFV